MTVICAVADPTNSRVFIGSDTLCSSGDTRLYVSTKWAVGPSWAIGLSGHWRFNQIAMRVVGDFGESLTVEKVADQLRIAIRDDGAVMYDDKGAPHAHDLSGLITDGRRIWHMSGAYCVIDVGAFGAAGSGREFAHGAMFAFEGLSADRRMQLGFGLQAAIVNCRGCGGKAWVSIFERPACALRAAPAQRYKAGAL